MARGPLTYHYQTTVLHNPAGTFSLVGTIPAYMDRLHFQDRAVAELARLEALDVLAGGEPGQFGAIAAKAPREYRPGSFHLKKILVTADMVSSPA